MANISDLPDDLLAVIKNRLATKQPLVGNGGTMTIQRSLVMAMIADRIISPGSKLSCSAGMHRDTAQNALAEELHLGEVDVHELYDAMDWLLERQVRIENKLAKTHLKDGGDGVVRCVVQFLCGKKIQPHPARLQSRSSQ